jgi:glycosyltransferase involved in cell wall biosynthesis
MKVAVLWTGLSGYLNACLKELAGRPGVELRVCHQAPTADAPYDEKQFAWMRDRLVWKTSSDLDGVERWLDAFDPDLIVMASWHLPQYRHAARMRRGRSLRVMVMDNAWRGTVKQWLGVCTAGIHVRPIADRAWLPGERQAVFARKMGFGEDQILWGSFSCDRQRFAQQYEARRSTGREMPRAFLYSGRLVRAKGIDVLAEAYARYRSQSQDPWPLICCGAGPERSLLEGREGIRVEGFVQPEALPGKLAESGCFILPSHFEPWALALHEAASAGLILLASEKVGAAVHLVQPGYNGFIFDSRDAGQLAALMARVAQLSPERREAMGEASYGLAQQYSPQRWAQTLIDAYMAFDEACVKRGTA